MRVFPQPHDKLGGLLEALPRQKAMISLVVIFKPMKVERMKTAIKIQLNKSKDL